MSTIASPSARAEDTAVFQPERAHASRVFLLEELQRPANLAAAGVIALSFLALFFRWFITQHRHSLEAMEDWGHAYAIPLISGFLIWRQRHDLKKVAARVFWPALPVMLTGVSAYFFAVVGIKNHMLQGFSMILTLFGVVLLLLGPGAMQRLFLPIAYLAFGVTVSERIMIEITFRLQIIAAEGGWVILSLVGQLAGFTVDLRGNTLHVFPGGGARPIPLDVAEACSGMRMVIAFFALAGAVALVSCKHWWQRLALLLLAAPVAIFLNMIRVAVLGVLSLWDRDLATGDVHMLIGTLLLVPGLGLFLLIMWALNKTVHDEAAPAAAPTPAPLEGSPPAARLAAALVAIGVLAGSAAGFKYGIEAANIHLRKLPVHPPEGKLLRSIPTKLPSWERVGSDRIEAPDIEKALGTTNYLSRAYRQTTPEGARQRVIDLHLAYYTGRVDTVPHVPERCFVGAGIQVGPDGTSVHTIPIDTSGWTEATDVPEHRRGQIYSVPVRNEFGARVGTINLPRDADKMRLRVTQFLNSDGQTFYAGYFFIANGGVVDSAEGVRLLAFDLETRYAYYAKVQFMSPTARSPEELAEDAGGMLDELLPELMMRLPDWAAIESGRLTPDTVGSGS
jgi:exosortase